MKKPAIPAVPTTSGDTYNVLTSLKENVEIITGIRGEQLTPLSSSATLAQVIAKINEIITKLNAV